MLKHLVSKSSNRHFESLLSALTHTFMKKGIFEKVHTGMLQVICSVLKLQNKAEFLSTD